MQQGGRRIILRHGDRIVSKVFIPDAPMSDIFLREAIIKMATDGMDAGDVLEIIDVPRVAA